MDELFRITDEQGNEVKVGSKVRYFDSEADQTPGEVIEITDFDGDVDDDGRSITIAPDVIVKYPNGATEKYQTSEWEFSYSDYDDEGCPSHVEGNGKIEELEAIND